jgi:hypothetical protein
MPMNARSVTAPRFRKTPKKPGASAVLGPARSGPRHRAPRTGRPAGTEKGRMAHEHEHEPAPGRRARGARAGAGTASRPYLAVRPRGARGARVRPRGADRRTGTRPRQCTSPETSPRAHEPTSRPGGRRARCRPTSPQTDRVPARGARGAGGAGQTDEHPVPARARHEGHEHPVPDRHAPIGDPVPDRTGAGTRR